MFPRASRLTHAFAGVITLLLAVVLSGPTSARAQEPTPPGHLPEPTPRVMQFPAGRLAAPTMPPVPHQADFGAEVYYQVCMACHGDRGQGLTDEWRSAWDPQDQNCWQFRCHAQSHPPEGFVLPTTVPAVVGPQVAAQFPTALALHDFIAQQMPYQAPGSLPGEEYWQLTAYLARENGHDPGPQPLDAQRAATFYLQPQPAPAIEAYVPWLVGAVVLLAVAALVVLRLRAGRSRAS